MLTKKLRPGQKIPSELEISEGLGISRGSVREAMKILSAFGIVEIKVGDGTYIPSEPKNAEIDPLMFSFMLYNPNTNELSEFRKLIELDIVELIIMHKEKNETHRKQLAKNLGRLEKLRSANAGNSVIAQNDIEFHRLMGEACCNRLSKKIYFSVLDYFEYTILNTHDHQENGVESYMVHSQILEAINANNITLAKDAIYHSVDVWEKLQLNA